MIDQLVYKYHLRSVFAETDDDAVDFYQKLGFEIAAFTEDFDGEPVTRYRCQLKNNI